MKTYKVEVHNNNGSKYWYINDKLHREDGPAIEFVRGHKEWFINGKLHRTDGPAIEYADGSKLWYLNGEIHRTDGPAFEHTNGYKEWWINGKKMSEKEFNAYTNPIASCEGKVVEVDGVKYRLVKV